MIEEFGEIIRSKTKNIVWVAYQQGVVFCKFKQRGKLVKMITEVGDTRSKIAFKIAIVRLIAEYPKAKISSLCPNFLKQHMKKIK